MIRVLIALSLAMLATAQANAAGKTVLQQGGEAFGITLPPPDGFCELDAAHPADRDMLSLIQELNAGHNQVLAISAECSQLNALRGKGVLLSNYAMYLMPLSAGEIPSSMSRAQVIESVAGAFGQFDSALDRAEDVMRDRLANADAAIELQDLVNVGLLHRDDDALFTGILTRAVDPATGEEEVTAVVTGLTLVANRIVTLNLSAPYEGRPTLDGLLAEQRQNVQRLLDAN